MRYFIDIQFLGAAYCGWQRQPGVPTVQQCVEEALTTLLRTPTAVTGAGRTDAGVNARSLPAHFDTDTELDIPAFERRLDAILPPDIAVNSLRKVADDAHARFDAVSRTYHYYVAHRRSPFFRSLSWFCPRPLDYKAMNAAAELLLHTSDFTSFAKLHTDTKTNICHVSHAAWRQIADDYWVFEITADRFLRNMVRAIVGTLVEVGRGKLSVSQFADIIAIRDRCAAGTSMPGHALYLWDVRYPY